MSGSPTFPFTSAIRTREGGSDTPVRSFATVDRPWDRGGGGDGGCLGRAPGKRPLPGSRSRSSRPSHAGLRMTHKVGGTAESPGGLPPFTAGFALPTSFFPPFPMWAPHDPPLSAPPLSPRERGAGGIGPGSSQNRSSPLPVRAEREWGGAGEGKQGPFPPGPLRRLNARLGEREKENVGRRRLSYPPGPLR